MPLNLGMTISDLSTLPHFWDVLARIPLRTLRPPTAELIRPPNHYTAELVMEGVRFTGFYTDETLDMVSADLASGGEIDLMEHSDEEISAILAPMHTAFGHELARAQTVLGEPTELDPIRTEAVRSACWTRQDSEVWLIFSDGDQDLPVYVYATVSLLDAP